MSADKELYRRDIFVLSTFTGRALTPSFRDGPKDQTRNLEIPGSHLRCAPE
jgi:hypothetical protein